MELELYDSVEILCSLYASSLSSQTQSEPINFILAEAQEVFADALYEKKEVKRALYYYRSASQYRKSNQTFKYRSQTPISSVEDARIRYKECKCMTLLRDYSNALRDLEGIPAKFRDVKISTLLGDLYKIFNRKRNAIIAYKEVLASVPTAVEVIEKLVCLGCDAADILSTLDEAYRYKDCGALVSSGWMHSLVAALVHKRNCDYEKSFTQLQKLSSLYPKNSYLLMKTGQNIQESVSRSAEEASALFLQVRQHDPHLVKGMESYGRLLYDAEDAYELSRLVDSVLESNKNMAPVAASSASVGWLLAGMYAALKGESESALQLIDKATRLDPAYQEAFKFKGQLHLTQSNADKAIIAYSQASSIQKDLAVYSGLVQANLSLGKQKEAAAAAREAISALPRSSEAYLLLGTVYSQSALAHSSEVFTAFSKALKLNPVSKDAAARLADVLVAQGKNEEAADCILNVLNHVSCHELRFHLAKIYTTMGRYQEAIENLHISISLNPEDASSADSEAMQELERIEGLLRGENVKEEEEEEVEEEEDNAAEDGTVVEEQEELHRSFEDQVDIDLALYTASMLAESPIPSVTMASADRSDGGEEGGLGQRQQQFSSFRSLSQDDGREEDGEDGLTYASVEGSPFIINESGFSDD